MFRRGEQKRPDPEHTRNPGAWCFLLRIGVFLQMNTPCGRYRSVRLFRQRAWGDWTGVFDRAAAALMAYGYGR